MSAPYEAQDSSTPELIADPHRVPIPSRQHQQSSRASKMLQGLVADITTHHDIISNIRPPESCWQVLLKLQCLGRWLSSAVLGGSVGPAKKLRGHAKGAMGNRNIRDNQDGPR
jgi:hypothetical protein